MSNLIARLIESGTPAALVAEVAQQLALAEARVEVASEAIAARRAKDRDRQNRRRSRDVTDCHVMSRDVTDKKDPDKEKSPKPPKEINPKNNPPISPHPDWLPADEWAAFVEMRRSIRKPMTARAVELAIGKLDQYRRLGHKPAEVLNQSILNSWQDLFPPRENSVKPKVKIGL